MEIGSTEWTRADRAPLWLWVKAILAKDLLRPSSPSFCKSIQGFQRRLKARVSYLTLPVGRIWVSCSPSRLQLFPFPHSSEPSLYPIPTFHALQPHLKRIFPFCPHIRVTEIQVGDCKHLISPFEAFGEQIGMAAQSCLAGSRL